MFRDLLFEIPIYNCSQEEWTKNEESRFREYVKLRKQPDEEPKERLKQFQREFDSHDDIIWLYNGIIGWIRFVVENDFIVAHLYRINNKRIPKIPKNKTFEYVGRRGKEQIDANMSSVDIGNVLKKMIDSISSRSEFKNRFVDRGFFDRINNYIDWQKIILP